ncbi:MAG: hypothetical protein IPG74_09510 [Flavobacteriales bacterium]|nr:hypothetical protein [Flavobacteriales bacterium]
MSEMQGTMYHVVATNANMELVKARALELKTMLDAPERTTRMITSLVNYLVDVFDETGETVAIATILRSRSWIRIEEHNELGRRGIQPQA